MPALEGLNSGYKSRGVQVVGVLLDSPNAARAGVIHKKTGAGFDTLLDDGTFSGKVFAVPQKFFVNSQGKVVYAILGGTREDHLKSVVETMLE